jgi:hypothetical protein
MLRSFAVAAVMCVAAVATAGLRSQLAVNVSGVYTSNWDEVTLHQDGTRVRGTYVCCGGGTIDGRIVEGRVIKFHWHEPRGAGDGEGVWVIKDGRLDGTWGHGQSATDGGPWTLAPRSGGQFAN